MFLQNHKPFVNKDLSNYILKSRENSIKKILENNDKILKSREISIKKILENTFINSLAKPYEPMENNDKYTKSNIYEFLAFLSISTIGFYVYKRFW